MKNTTLFRFLLVSRVLLVGLALTGVLAPELHAAKTITVRNRNDSGLGSLRQALANAMDGDTINFSVTGPPPILLTTGALVVNKNVTISGPGATKLSISGGSKTPVLKILNPGGQGIVKISGVSILKGNSSPDSSGNSAGGIFIGEGSSLRLENSNVSDNHSEQGGGGIMNLGSLELIGCNVNINTNNMQGTRGGGGGIVTGEGSSSRLEKSNVIRNSSTFGPGGILNRGYLELSFCVVDGNTTTNPAGGTFSQLSGGITNMASGEAHITQSTISNNCGARGGRHRELRPALNLLRKHAQWQSCRGRRGYCEP